MTYSEYLSECLDRNIKYSEYIAENVGKSIEYAQYIAEQIDSSISYGEYAPGKSKEELIREERKEKLDKIFNKPETQNIDIFIDE